MAQDTPETHSNGQGSSVSVILIVRNGQSLIAEAPVYNEGITPAQGEFSARDAKVEMALLPDVLLHKRIHGANALLRAMRRTVARERAAAGGSGGAR